MAMTRSWPGHLRTLRCNGAEVQRCWTTEVRESVRLVVAARAEQHLQLGVDRDCPRDDGTIAPREAERLSAHSHKLWLPRRARHDSHKSVTIKLRNAPGGASDAHSEISDVDEPAAKLVLNNVG